MPRQPTGTLVWADDHYNESYRSGDILIEHGNRYDVWNAIDHDGLRETVSCASRGEVTP